MIILYTRKKMCKINKKPFTNSINLGSSNWIIELFIIKTIKTITLTRLITNIISVRYVTL